MLRREYNMLVIREKYPPPVALNRKPVVVSLQNSVFTLGGLCDRLRGMCGIYTICRDLGLEYKIGHFRPFDLSDFLQPNMVDWAIKEEEIEWDKRLVALVYADPLPAKLTGKKTTEENNAYNRARVSRMIEQAHSKRQVHVYANLYCIDYKTFSRIFHELFKPSEELKQQVEWNKQQTGEQYISITTRFQNLLGDFYEGDSVGTLETEQEKKAYIKRCIERVEDIHLQYPDMKVLVTSDSSRFLSEISRLSYVHVNPGKVVHMQFTTDCSHEVYLKSFVDLFTIAGAVKVYQLTTGRMYVSGFPVTAASIDSRPYELIRF